MPKEQDRGKAFGAKWIAGIVASVVAAVLSAVLIAHFSSREDQGAQGEETEPLKILIFRATPSTIQPGEMSTLQWDIQNASQVRLNGELVALVGNKNVRPRQRTTYTLMARNEEEETASETIEVDVPPIPSPEILTFEVRPHIIELGERSELRWKTKRATTVLIDEKSVALSGNRMVGPQRTTEYTLVATNDKGGEVTASTEVEVIPPPLKILRFDANPSSIERGRSATLHWETEDAYGVTLNGARVAHSGEMTVHPRMTTTYELLITNQRGNKNRAIAEVEVVLPPAPKIIFLEAEPPRVPQGRSSELRWSTLNATRVTLNGKSVASLDEINVSPQKTTRYVLVATNEAGVVERAETTVEVVRRPTIGYFNAEKTTIYEGEETTLRWNTRDANRVRLDGKTVPLSGSKKVRPRATTTYSLIAEKGGLNVHESRQVTVKRRVQRTTSENFISSVTPQKLVESDAVKKAITIIIEGGDLKQAKRLMAKMAYSDGFTLNLDLSRFETAGGTIRQAQMIAAKLWKIGIRVDIRR